MMTSKKIPSNIKMLRELKNVTRKAISDHLGMTINGYAKIEQGNVDITLKKLEEISKVLEVELNDIINFDPSKILVNHSLSNKYNPRKEESHNQRLSDLYYLHKLIESLERENTMLRKNISKKD